MPYFLLTQLQFLSVVDRKSIFLSFKTCLLKLTSNSPSIYLSIASAKYFCLIIILQYQQSITLYNMFDITCSVVFIVLMMRGQDEGCQEEDDLLKTD